MTEPGRTHSVDSDSVTALTIQRLTACVWISDQLMSIAAELVKTSRKRIRHQAA
jgi:hypothetical protein